MKMNKTSQLLSAITIATALLVSPLSFSSNIDTEQAPKVEKTHKADKKKQHSKKHEMQKFGKELALTNEQKQSIKQIKKESKNSLKALEAELKPMREQMKSLLANTQFDEKAFLDIYRQYQSVFEKIAIAKAKSKFDTFNVLTDEQREKAKAKAKRKHDKKPKETV